MIISYVLFGVAAVSLIISIINGRSADPSLALSAFIVFVVALVGGILLLVLINIGFSNTAAYIITGFLVLWLIFGLTMD